ncbi:MAG: aldo/keto reductase [Prochlorococcus sp.]
MGTAGVKGIGFGTWSWGNKLLWGYSQRQHDPILQATFEQAVRAGLSLIDTADSYGTGQLNGRSELLLGRFVESLPIQQRQRLTIATKLAPYPWRLGRSGFNRAFKASQRRLQGHVKRVQLHWSTARYAPWQEGPLLDGLADLAAQGNGLEVGVSNVGPQRLRWIHARLAERGVKLISVQVQLSLLARQPLQDKQVMAVCRDMGIELLAYSPLALGLLTITPGEMPQPATRLRRGLFNRLLPGSLDLRQGLADIARHREVSQAQVALNWCRAHGATPIAGLRTPDQAIDVSGALAWMLEAEEIKKLDALAKDCAVGMPANPFQSR